MDLAPELSQEFLRPLVNGWIGKLDAAKQYRSQWEDIATECMDFYARSATAMWDTSVGKRIFKGSMQSKFRISINKAFELVAVYGPGLMWNIPHRQVLPRKPFEIPLEMFGSPDDPQAQMLLQSAQAEMMQRLTTQKAIASLMQGRLNYTAIESNLERHSEMAVIDAMVKGRGCLWLEKYSPPTSRRTLTGAFRDPPENLFIDPDFDSLDKAKWIARRRVMPVWECERLFKLEPGSLKGRATLESEWSKGERTGDSGSSSRRAAGQTNDLIEFYEIYSKTGVGVRLTGMETIVKDKLDAVVGDYAYLAIAKSVPYPLNCPTESLRKGMSSDEVRKRFEWPCPLWADNEWPVACLDFYIDPESSWPIAPLAPGLGELKFLNVFMGHLCNRIWSSSRDFIVVLESAMADLEEHLKKGEDLCVIPLKDIQGSVDKVIGFLKQPEVNKDVWTILEAVSELFDKRTGLTEFHYAMNPEGTQNRTAEESKNKRFAAGIRPEYMQKKVVEWQGKVASIEAMLTRWYVTGEDVQPQFGNIGRQLWEQFVMSSDVEDVTRQMEYTVAASSISRPNRDRDSQNVQALLQSPLVPLIQEYAMATGNIDPINALISKYGEVNDMDLSDIRLETPEKPEVDPEQQKLEQEMQMEQQRLEGEMQLKGMDMELKRQELEAKAALAQIQMQIKEREMELKAQEGEMKLAMDAQQHQQALQQDSQKHALDMRQQAVMGQQKIVQNRIEGITKVEQTKAMGKEKIAATKAMAKAKPKPAPKVKAKK